MLGSHLWGIKMLFVSVLWQKGGGFHFSGSHWSGGDRLFPPDGRCVLKASLA